MPHTFTGDFRRFFGRGLGILLPSILTLWILWQALVFVYNNVAEPINRGVRTSVIYIAPQFFDEGDPPEWFRVTEDQVRARLDQAGDLPTGEGERAGVIARESPRVTREIRRDRLRQFWKAHWYLEVTGFFVAIVLIYLSGVLLGNYLGRQIYGRLEKLISRIPGFKQIYPHVKQVVDLILGDRKMAFSKVVLVEYPSAGIWTVGFLTGDSMRQIDKLAGDAVVSVFIPTSPTPFTGFTINVPASQAKPMDLTIEEALRFVITAGVLTPERQAEADAAAPAASLAPATAATAAAGEEKSGASEAARAHSKTDGSRPGDGSPA